MHGIHAAETRGPRRAAMNPDFTPRCTAAGTKGALLGLSRHAMSTHGIIDLSDAHMHLLPVIVFEKGLRSYGVQMGNADCAGAAAITHTRELGDCDHMQQLQLEL